MSKRALILDGRIGDDAFADRLLSAATGWLEAADWSATRLMLRDLHIAPCTGCFGCWIKTPGECVIADAGRDVAKAIATSDLVVYLTPVIFGGYSHPLKRAIDRSIPIILPLFRRVRGEVHHKKRYVRYPRMLGLGWVDPWTKEQDNLFRTLIARNAINMHAPAAGCVVLDRQGSVAAIDEAVARTFAEVVGAS